MAEAITDTAAADHADLGFDPNALRDKYREERDRRLRADGNQQYVEVKDAFAHFVEDPYVEPGFDREPLTEDTDVVVIGGGFGGLLASARLREAGVQDIRVIERGGDFGGTWYWNRYPGAQCDIEAYIYLPLLEELGYVPKEKYSFAPEILDHAEAIGRKYDLYENACFQTEVTHMEWDEKALRWILHTNRGDRMTARFVIMSNGPLNRPKLPGIEGIESFEGHSFHTSRWDYGYTGGDSNGSLTRLKDKRVGIIGTGATAVQCVPHLGAAVKELHVFQRTPSSIDVRGNKPTDPEWANSLNPGWQHHRMTNFNVLVTGGHQDEDLVSDGWTDIIRNLAVIAATRREGEDNDPAAMAERVELADFRKMEVGTAYTRRAGYDITGKGGQTLSEKWADGLRTLHGFQTNGFPNCFFMGVTQGGFTANFPHMLNEQSLHIAYVVTQGIDRNVNCVEASVAGENEWVDTIKRSSMFNQKFLEECTPGYYNNEGQPGGGNSLIGSAYGGGPEAFFQILRDWRAEGGMQGVELS